MKLCFMTLSGALISLGLVRGNIYLLNAGALIHLSNGIISLCFAYRDAKLLRAGTLEIETHNSIPTRVANWIEGAITIAGLALTIIGQDNSNYATAGMIIWGGTIACYFIWGIIAREVGGIPLSMWYGGWQVRRYRNGRYRR